MLCLLNRGCLLYGASVKGGSTIVATLYTAPATGNIKMKCICCCKCVCFSRGHGLCSRRKCLVLYTKGFSIHDIHARLGEEEISISKKTLYSLLKKHHAYTVGLQIYEGQIVKECLLWTGWLVG